METRIPDIPGTLLQDDETRLFLNGHIAQLCGLSNDRCVRGVPCGAAAR